MIVKKDKDAVQSYLRDASNLVGKADVVYIPENSDELIAAIANCAKNRTPISVSGGGTGITGGRVPEGGAVVSTEKLTRIWDFDPNDKTVRVGAGTTINDLREYLSPRGFFYPPDPTEINATIGGNIATNASGARSFKYGSTRNYVAEIRVALASGEEVQIIRGENFENGGKLALTTNSGKLIEVPISQFTSPSVKNAAGFYMRDGMDAIDLFVGSEGTLGAISEAKLNFFAAPQKIIGGIVFYDKLERLLAHVDELRRLGISKSGIIQPRLIEFFDENSLNLIREEFSQIPQNSTGAIWFEQECEDMTEESLLNEWYYNIDKYTKYADLTWLADSELESERQRQFRRALPLRANEIISRNNRRKIGTDAALPVEKFIASFRLLRDTLEESGLDFVSFGHIGDCHVHTNIFPKDDGEEIISRRIYDDYINFVIASGGTISAEHGVGKLKKKYLRQWLGESAMEKMKAVKRAIDPENLFGMGNLF